MDYRPEWLNYNLEGHLPADFPVETLSNVTSATVDNVVPYAYRSAILKGQTLVNLIRTISKTTLGQYQDVVNVEYVEPSTKYLLKIKNNTSEAKSFYSSEITEWTQIDIEANQTITKTLTTKSTLGRNTLLQNAKTHTTEHDLSIIFIKYQEGMENWDISYFEGMQSVKMPVLRTTGKNQFDGELISGYISTTGAFYKESSSVCSSNFNQISSNEDVTIKRFDDNNGIRIAFYDNDFNFITVSSYANGKTMKIVTPSNAKYFKLGLSNTTDVKTNVQVEYGTQPTSYEPSYKSIILTVNEEFELRGIGEVQDTLDCLTGELTQRVGEIVLDGSESWMKNDFTHDILNEFLLYKNLSEHKEFLMSNRLPVYGSNNERVANLNNTIYIRVLKNKANTVEEFKTWLASNNINVLTKLATESIKTVDLNIQDQDGNTLSKIKPMEGTMNIHSDGTPLKPTITMEIPVEAITQNLASFIKGE